MRLHVDLAASYVLPGPSSPTAQPCGNADSAVFQSLVRGSRLKRTRLYIVEKVARQDATLIWKCDDACSRLLKLVKSPLVPS